MLSNRWIFSLSGVAAVVMLTLCGCPPVVPGLSVAVTADKTTGNPPVTVLATAIPSGGTAPYSYQWSSAPGGVLGAPTAAGTNVTFLAAGTNTVTCTVTDSANNTASNSVQIHVGTGTTPTGNAANGQAIFSAKCVGCHPSPSALKSAAGRITNTMGTINAAMNGITLTDQEVLDLQAYLNSL